MSSRVKRGQGEDDDEKSEGSLKRFCIRDTGVCIAKLIGGLSVVNQFEANAQVSFQYKSRRVIDCAF